MRSLLLLFLLLASTACGGAPDDEIGTATSSTQISWLGGCWQTQDGATVETWVIADDTHAFGSNFSLKDGKVSFFEHMRIEPHESGLAFQAYPAGNGPSGFLQEAIDKNTITFANDEHDYPQRIKYWRTEGILSAKISLMDDTKPFQWNFYPCKD